MSQLRASLEPTEGMIPTLADTVSQEIESLSHLADLQQEAAVTAAVSMLGKARRILVTGARSAYSVAYYAGFLLRELLDNVWYFPAGAEDAYEMLEKAGDEDVLLAVSFLRYARSSHRLVEFAAERNVRIVALTDGPISPIAPRAEVSLFAPSLTPFHSYVAAMTVVDVLVSAVAQSSRERIAADFEKRQQMLLEQQVFV